MGCRALVSGSLHKMWLPLVALSALPHRRHEHHVSRILHSLPRHNVTLPNASFYNEALADHFDRPLSWFGLGLVVALTLTLALALALTLTLTLTFGQAAPR